MLASVLVTTMYAKALEGPQKACMEILRFPQFPKSLKDIVQKNFITALLRLLM